MDVRDLTFMGDTEVTVKDNIGVLLRWQIKEVDDCLRFRDAFRRFGNDLKLVVLE